MFLRFLRDRRANVLPIFAIAAVPLIVATGGVVDYSRGFDQKTVVQDALDAAALAAGKKIGLISETLVKQEAQTFFTVNVGNKVEQVPVMTPTIVASTITLTTTLKVPTYFLGMIGLDEFSFDLIAKATLAMGTIEVALALDNSGSMSGTKMATLIVAANDLTKTLYALGATSTMPDPVKVALVPFASSVKVDPANKTAAWMDTTGVAPYNAESFEGFTGAPPVSNNTPSGKNVLTMFDTFSGAGSAWAGCIEERQAPYDVQDDAATTATPGTMFVPMFAPDEPDNWTCTTTSTCSYSGTSNATRRYNGAPPGNQDYNNYLPDAGTTTTCGALTISKASPAVVTFANHGLAANTRVVFHTTGSLPAPLTPGTTYYVRASGLTANAFRLSKTSGGAAINTTSNGAGTHSLTNNWTCESGSANCGGTAVGKSEQTALLGQIAASAKYLCKYGTVTNKAAISAITVDTNGGGTYPGGPNFNCTTDQVVPLTATKTNVATAIGSMAADGTTNITAGLMWGWRVLSPTAPFTEGRSYSASDNQKILILMTDGENTYFANSKFTVSYYGAWGYVWKSHLGTTSSSESTMQGKMEERMALACTNIKATGIKVYTIGFMITDQATLDLLSACATTPQMAFQSDSTSALTAAFTAIGDEISQLRIAQ